MKKLTVLSITLLLSNLSITAQAMEGENWQKTEQSAPTNQTTETNWFAKLPLDILKEEILTCLQRKDRGCLAIACLADKGFSKSIHKSFEELLNAESEVEKQLERDNAGKLAPKQAYMKWLPNDLALYIISLLPPTERFVAAFGILNQLVHKHNHRIDNPAALASMAMNESMSTRLNNLPFHESFKVAKIIFRVAKQENLLRPTEDRECKQYTELKSILRNCRQSATSEIQEWIDELNKRQNRIERDQVVGMHRLSILEKFRFPVQLSDLITPIKEAVIAGADINIKNESGSSLLTTIVHSTFASDEMRAKLVRKLLELGADPNIQHEDGCTPLILAILKKDAKTVAALLDHGANPELALKETSPLFAGESALSLAETFYLHPKTPHYGVESKIYRLIKNASEKLACAFEKPEGSTTA